MNSWFGIGTIVSALLALLGGILAARKLYRTPKQIGRRELAVFSFCYVIWLIGGPFALGWRYPAATIWFFACASFIYLPVLISLALRCSGRKPR